MAQHVCTAKEQAHNWPSGESCVSSAGAGVRLLEQRACSREKTESSGNRPQGITGRQFRNLWAMATPCPSEYLLLPASCHTRRRPTSHKCHSGIGNEPLVIEILAWWMRIEEEPKRSLEEASEIPLPLGGRHVPLGDPPGQRCS